MSVVFHHNLISKLLLFVQLVQLSLKGILNMTWAPFVVKMQKHSKSTNPPLLRYSIHGCSLARLRYWCSSVVIQWNYVAMHNYSKIHDYHSGLYTCSWDISGQTIFIQAFGDLMPPPMNVEFYGFTNIILEQPSSNHTGVTYGCSTDVQEGSLVRVNTTVTAPRKFFCMVLYITVGLL